MQSTAPTESKNSTESDSVAPSKRPRLEEEVLKESEDENAGSASQESDDTSAESSDEEENTTVEARISSIDWMLQQLYGMLDNKKKAEKQIDRVTDELWKLADEVQTAMGYHYDHNWGR